MRKVIALESRLKKCRRVATLGVRPNFSDYSEQEKALIRDAEKVYYPTRLYAELLAAAGKAIFPSIYNYLFSQDKIKQSALFALLDIPHPKTRVFYGRRQKEKILDHFSYPFVAKKARGSAMGRDVFLIRTAVELEGYLETHSPAYIQDYLPVDRDIRVVVIGRGIVHAYWRVAAEGEFRSNVAQGARVAFDPVPQEALDLALRTAAACGWNDVGLDICLCEGTYYVLEGNMKYGKEGFRAAGMDFYDIMDRMIENGDI
ncbi:MAG: RimK family alpha-L-glutamate ligase [Deltaproteobacteria bacterium]|nr:RimK family alpha-L-glutamate ligase [Deltaproteobacteria bacterium]